MARSTSDAEELSAMLHPDLREALASKSSIGQKLAPAVLALPVLTQEGAARLEAELRSNPGLRTDGRLVLTRSEGEQTPLAAALAALLAREVLPRLAPLVGSNGEPVRLCSEGRHYVLRYSAEAAADNGRVFRCHQDDSDLTLAVCLGSSSGWRGADLLYVRDSSASRPGTPDLNAPETSTVRHVHQIGVGVLHGGGVYHLVEPLLSGERLTLVVLAMRDDAAWKRTFYAETGGAAS